MHIEEGIDLANVAGQAEDHGSAVWGPRLGDDGGAEFRLWAPGCDRIGLIVEDRTESMSPAADGWFEHRTNAAPGDAYAFVLPDGRVVPDPASRSQAGGVGGPSRLVDPKSYRWQCEWSGAPWSSAVIYELHVGTFTPEGTFAAAQEKLSHLAKAGVTAVEIMPVAQFDGDRGWGYDGVLPYAPHPAYGSPDDMKAFIDAAHRHGLMVLLDVVYNHFGPEGNFLSLYAPDFFDETRQTPWGAAIAYEKRPVREFFIQNALYWCREFRLDGLRLDAIDHVRDRSDPELLVELAERVRVGIPDRPIHLTTEDNRNITALHERGPGGEVTRYTAEWNDDLHNAAHVIATGEAEGYYADFAEDPWWLYARALSDGFAFQGEVAPQAGGPRGEPSSHLPPLAFVDFLQNHDQVGNRALGERLNRLAQPALLEAMQAILLLSPHIPLIFMGDEFGETRPFLFFTDFHGDLARAVREGRRREFAEFAAFAGDAAGLLTIPDPNDIETFEASKLDWSRCETSQGAKTLDRLRSLLAIRQERIAPHLGAAGSHSGRVLSREEGALAVDWALDGMLLQLRANLSDDAAQLPPARGEVIWSNVPDVAGAMPASSVAFFTEVV